MHEEKKVEIELEEEPCWQPCIVKCIMDYSYCQTIINECCLDIYHSNSHIENCVDGIVSIRHSILSNCYYIEPEYENWLCIVHIDNEGILKEEYMKINELSFDVISMAQNLIHLYRKNKSAFSILKLKNEYFINIHKTFYSHYFMPLKNSLLKDESTYECTFTFLSIVYKKGDQDSKDDQEYTPISIDLDRGYYMKGNIILTPAFILRELSYRNISKDLFDPLNYTLEIMDQNLNIFTVQSDQYILLDIDEYKVVNLDSDYSDSSSKESANQDIGLEII
jgi:hypothetical protein